MYNLRVKFSEFFKTVVKRSKRNYFSNFFLVEVTSFMTDSFRIVHLVCADNAFRLLWILSETCLLFLVLQSSGAEHVPFRSSVWSEFLKSAHIVDTSTPASHCNINFNIILRRGIPFGFNRSQLYVRGSYRKSWATIFCKGTCFIIDKPNTPS